MKFFVDLDEVKQAEMAPGITVRFMSQDNLTTGLVEVAPNAAMPKHVHAGEKSGVVIEGELDLTIGGETRTVHQGDVFLVPGGAEISFVGSDESSVFLIIFISDDNEHAG